MQTVGLSVDLELRITTVEEAGESVLDVRLHRRRPDEPLAGGAFEPHGGFRLRPDQAKAVAGAILAEAGAAVVADLSRPA
jgi:hypothetical protein